MKHIKKYNETIDFDNIDDEEEIIPDRFKGYEQFYEFLKKNNVVDKYLIKFDDNYRSHGKDLKKFLDKTPYDSYIINAFSWGGDRYLWNRLHDDWYYEAKKIGMRMMIGYKV